MFRTISRRVIASLVGFFLGWTVFQVARPAPAAEVPVIERAAVQISSITLKRQGCTDAELECPVYDVTYRSDGSGTFIGYKNNESYDGKFNTVFDPRDFAFLVEQFEKHRFLDIPQHYATSPDEETVVLEVMTNEGPRVFTTHNWSSIPSELRVLEAVVDNLSYQVIWADAD
jgi:hypothetical protein